MVSIDMFSEMAAMEIVSIQVTGTTSMEMTMENGCVLTFSGVKLYSRDEWAAYLQADLDALKAHQANALTAATDAEGRIAAAEAWLNGFKAAFLPEVVEPIIEEPVVEEPPIEEPLPPVEEVPVEPVAEEPVLPAEEPPAEPEA